MLRYYRKSFCFMLDKLKNIEKNPELILDTYELQMYMINKIKYIEKKIFNIKNLTNTLKVSFNNNLTNNQKIDITKKIKQYNQKISDYKKLITLIKMIGDGIAFVYVDKYNIKPFAFKQNSGFISGKEGLKNELKTLRYFYDNNIIAILNDITNSLRYGDITVPLAQYPYIVEVKSSKNTNKRIERQKQNIANLMRYIETDKGKGIYDENIEMIRVDIHSKELNHVRDFNKCIEHAYKYGNCIEEIETGLMYYIECQECDFEIIAKTITTKMKEPIFFFLNEEKYNTLGYYPFTLSIESRSHLIDFYNGDILLNVIIDLKVVEQKLYDKGLIVKFNLDELYTLSITYKENPNFDENKGLLKVSYHYFNRISNEFISLDWFINELSYKFKEKLKIMLD